MSDLNEMEIRQLLRQRIEERYGKKLSKDVFLNPLLLAMLEDEGIVADLEKVIPFEIIQQVAENKSAALSVSQALEKARSLADGNILRQESYQDILNQVDVRERYPFTVALVEHEIKVAEVRQAMSVGPGSTWTRRSDNVKATVKEVNPDGSIGADSDMGWLNYDNSTEWLQDFEPYEDNRSGAVDILTKPETEENLNYTHYSDFPSSEIPSEPAGQSELSYPSIRRVEGLAKDAVFEDLASPTEQMMMNSLVDKGDMESAWELMKDVSTRSNVHEGEVGNSLIDLTTEKWGANDEVLKTGEYNSEAFLTLDQIDAGLGPCGKKRR